MKTDENQRILALDVLRGITIAGMILVNNPGSWSAIYAPLDHASWIGLTPTDLVFPFFMFIMGISTYISLRKYNFEFSKSAVRKIVKRTVVIYAIGLAIAWLSLSFRNFNSLASENMAFGERFLQSVSDFAHLRLLGVLPRLALCYGATAIIAIVIKHKYIPVLAFTTLFAYFLILIFGNGFEHSEQNIISVIDRSILGVNHMYKDAGLNFDPEGLLSTIPAICHVLIGFWCGELMMGVKENSKRIQRLFLVGTILTFSGFLLSYGCPISKKIWSPTFVLVTCGFASSLLALLIWIIDIKGYKTWSRFFESFGVNPLFIYTTGAVLSILTGSFLCIYGVDGELIGLKTYIYKYLLQPFLGDFSGSLAFALLFVGVNWAIGYILYKKKIYIKI
ncbi:MAG: heparan-alpha-glucosaminide N-acetyltransferase domain-containing protein [Bacteroidales bacterium]|nr:heparan-alpha-glucosaminide N-acetyltransferase domain-containing protein [Bacteroidales bacterium]